MCVCGNFQQKRPWESFYTASIDISSIRVVLSEAAQQRHWGVSSLDVATGFLNAPMPKGDDETIYVKPPALLEQFHLVKSNIYWKLHKAVYGLRVSPRLWGKERDLQLKAMRFRHGGVRMRATQSSIDVALWVIIEDIMQDFDHKRKRMAIC